MSGASESNDRSRCTCVCWHGCTFCCWAALQPWPRRQAAAASPLPPGAQQEGERAGQAPGPRLFVVPSALFNKEAQALRAAHAAGLQRPVGLVIVREEQVVDFLAAWPGGGGRACTREGSAEVGRACACRGRTQAAASVRRAALPGCLRRASAGPCPCPRRPHAQACAPLVIPSGGIFLGAAAQEQALRQRPLVCPHVLRHVQRDSMCRVPELSSSGASAVTALSACSCRLPAAYLQEPPLCYPQAG